MENPPKPEPISLRGALDLIWYNLEPFSLDFVTTKGERRHKKIVRNQSQKQDSSDDKPESERKYHNVKGNNLLMLTNLETGETFNVKISLLMRINGRQIIHFYE